MLPPKGRERTQYRKPNRLNTVSLTLAALAGLVFYVGYSLWPAGVMRLRARGVLDDALPLLYRINLRGETAAKQEVPKLQKDILVNLQKAGIRAKVKLVVQRSAKLVAIEAHFPVMCEFPFINKRVAIEIAPRAQTDATRVDW